MNAVRLMLGTLTVLPVRSPALVDRQVAGRAMVLAPAGAAALAVVAGFPLALVERYAVPVGPLLLAGLTIGLLAFLTRAIHLDGLADTADGLGSGRHGEPALAIMRKSDTGPFGVVTLLLVLLIQVAALAQSLSAGHGPAALVTALVVSRAVLPVLCTPAFPAARADGLGRTVAGTVSVPRAGLAVLLATALAGVLLVCVVALGGVDPARASTPALIMGLGVGALLALAAGVALALHASRRLGGVTGDVYGAAVEATFTTALVLAAILV